jgi:hypothetical protein
VLTTVVTNQNKATSVKQIIKLKVNLIFQCSCGTADEEFEKTGVEAGQDAEEESQEGEEDNGEGGEVVHHLCEVNVSCVEHG